MFYTVVTFCSYLLTEVIWTRPFQ